jgi:serine/threonine protein kinase
MTEPQETGFSTSSAPPLPRVFGRLLLLKLLARGGMGDVYLAASTGIEGAERACVVKTVRRDHIHDGSFLARFLDEARVQSQLNHPGVAQVLEASTDENGEPFTVVEYVEGRSLSDIRQRAIQLGCRVGWAEAVSVAIEMSQALAHVHERSGADGSPLGIVHRDLSPQNVMIGYAGEVKLIDFGTARGHNRKCHTVAGVVFAKPGYVAPEVARQQVGDGRIDLYALGIMLWELCKGTRFLSGDAQKHLEDAAAGKIVVPKLAESIGAPPLLDEIIEKLTLNDPDERYASASLAVMDLARLLSEAPSTKGSERGVRARVSILMRTLWPHEPARSRADFARLLKEARSLIALVHTPTGGKAQELALAQSARISDDPQLLSGTPYRLARKIGEGASGVVYEAEHVELGRKVALKVLAAGHASATDAIERFRREARAVARLSHPNLVQLYDFGKSLDGRVFLAMELLRGETLDRRIKRLGGMDWREAAELGIEVCKALEAAHGAGLVHRDLKPANLFLTDAGGLKLLDFGVAMALADVVNDASEKRQKGFAIFGTPEYMAPEQVAGEVVDGRCDLYALGCVLYELVTGTRVFEGTSSVVIMGKQMREMPDAPRLRAPSRGIPEEVDAVILRALAKAPADRFATAAELGEALEELYELPVRRRARARRMAVGVMGGATLLALLGAGVRWMPADEGQRMARMASPLLHSMTKMTAAPEDPSPHEAELPAAVAPSTVAPNPEPAVSAVAVAPVAVSTNDVASADPPASPAPSAAPTVPASTGTSPAPSPAAGVARSAVEVDPVDQEVRHVERAMRTDRSDRHQLLTQAREAAKEHMSDGRALKAWTMAAYEAGRMREARHAAEAWALHDDTAEPRIFLAKVLDGMGHRTDAQAVLEEVLQAHPDSNEARRLHAKLGAPLPAADTSARRAQVARR